LSSVEGHDTQAHDPPRFDLPTNAADSALPPHIPSHLSQPSNGAHDDISSAASSPSAAYAGLSLEGERSGDSQGLDLRSSLAPADQDTRGLSPLRTILHRSIMGGAEDIPQRSSSPLKRPASELEADVPSSQQEDVDMISVSPSDPAESKEVTAQPISAKRAQSIDMLRNETVVAGETASASEEPDVETPSVKNPETGTRYFPMSRLFG
jgi:ubiquitin carboxyl-terminal hydrolase 4/11/15